MAKNPGKNGNRNVVQDSSLIRLPPDTMTLPAIDTLSQAEAACPPGENRRDEHLPSTPLRASDDEYHMAHRYRGKVIIFNHFQYYDNLDLEERRGTKVDCEAIQTTFKKIGFSIVVKQDPTKAEITKTLNTESSNQNFYSADCLVVIVLTHGGENNCLFAKDTSYNVSELWTPFLADKCPYLAAKPKIFIIQACRGDEASRKVDVNVDKMVTTDARSAGTGQIYGEHFSIPAEADILIAFSSFEGRYSLRDIEKGTWYISELCTELNANWQTDDLMTMLTRVNRNVAINKEHSAAKQMPSIQSTLTRKIYFQNNKKENDEKNISELIKKVDHLISLEDIKRDRTLSCQSTSAESRRDRDITKESGTDVWNELRLEINFPFGTPLKDENVLKVSKGLHLFLNDRHLKDEIYENGCTILALLSLWHLLDYDARQLAFGRLVSFMQTYAVDWRYYEIMDIPVKDSEERRSRRSSRCSTPTQKVKPKPPFK